MIRTLSQYQIIEIFNKSISAGFLIEYDYLKHRLVISEDYDNPSFFIRLPIHLKISESLTIETSRARHFIILLIQAGHCAMGYAEDENLLQHKVISTYMVRKKQGKSQVKYLKTKGKSRAGSRLRLANTIRFFEKINHQLKGYFGQNPIDRIALSCSKTLLPYLFNSKVNCPFDKRDYRIYSIPKHIHPPNLKILKQTHHFLVKGSIHFESVHQKLISEWSGFD
jgi:hypothetical protein